MLEWSVPDFSEVDDNRDRQEARLIPPTLFLLNLTDLLLFVIVEEDIAHLLTCLT